jgi:hypothetical protein
MDMNERSSITERLPSHAQTVLISASQWVKLAKTGEGEGVHVCMYGYVFLFSYSIQ